MASNHSLAISKPAILAAPLVVHSDVLGVPFAIRSNHRAMLARIADHCRVWRAVESPSNIRAIELDIDVDVDVASGIDGRIEVHATRDHLVLTGNGINARADAVIGVATCRLSDRRTDSPRLIEEIVEPLLLFLVSRADRTPIHAAACVIDGVAVILAGPSGVGKSCLAYAARNAGWPVLSDDIVYIQLRPSLHVWGLPQSIHVFPEDAPFSAGGALRWRNGKLKRAMAVEGERPSAARRAVLCRIERGDAVALDIVKEPISPDSLPPLEPGFDLRGAESRAAYTALTTHGSARLTLSRDPAEAIATLCRHRDALAEIATG